MKNLAIRWIVGVVAVYACVRLTSSVGLRLEWPDTWRMIVFVPVLALINGSLGSIIRLLTVPVTCMTLGLFGFVVNAIVFWTAVELTGGKTDFWGALFGSVCVTVLSSIISWLIKDTQGKDK
jgi:putative membrane protein